MASFISGLSLLILVLINGCFTLPITQVNFTELTATSFYDDLTTEKSFGVRTVDDNELFTSTFDNIKRSENEDTFLQTETIPTVPTDLKRSLSEPEHFEFTTVGDVSRPERLSEDLLTTTDEQTTERSFEIKDSVKEKKTDVLNTISHEHETEHVKRTLEDENVTIEPIEKSNDDKIDLEFTTSFMPLFTSTSSDIAPELYTPESTEFSLIETSTRKYVGSLVDPEEETDDNKTHVEHDEEDSKKDDKKSKKGSKTEDDKHREEEEEHNDEEDSKKHDKTPEKESMTEDDKHKEEEHNVEEDEKSDKKDKSRTSVNKITEDPTTGEKYAVGELYDQDLSKIRQRLQSNVAVLDESDKPVNPKLRLSSTTKKTITKPSSDDEESKLNQGEESS